MSALKNGFRAVLPVMILTMALTLSPVYSENNKVAFSELPAGNSLGDYIQFALQNNPRISAADSDLESQRNQITIASSLPDPMAMSNFGIEGGYGIGVSQRIPFPTKILTERRAATQMLERQKARREQVRADIVSEVVEAYSKLYNAKRMYSILNDNLELLIFLEDNARIRYTVGGAPQSQLVRIQVEMARAEDALQSNRQKIDSYRQKLAAVLDLEDVSLISVDTESEYVSGISGSDEEIVARILSKNFTLQIMESELEVAETMVSLARQQYLPDLEVGTEYMGGGGMDGSWSVGVKMTLPVWVRRNRAEVQQASEVKESVRKIRDDMANQIRAEAVSTVNDLRDSQRKMKLYTDVLIPQATQVVQLTQTDYQTGSSGIMELIDSQRTLLQLEEQLIAEQLRVKKAESELIRLTGVDK
ncbi:Heavy metal RND efflux outer membrane protein, CzcC family [Chitinispirillum alkaliphilum]|nr:Heavy metal RND efflux outer membrane protein, CzcC family [Chitinispirillum alkaliphilum]